MPYVDVDVDDFYNLLSSRERDELIGYLEEDGHLKAKGLVDPNNEDTEELLKGNVLDIEWAQLIQKINSARYRLSAEQEAMLVNLAKSL